MENIIKNDITKVVEKINFEELSGKDILITGASGLLGTYFLYTLDELSGIGCKLNTINIVIRNDLPVFLTEIVKKLGAKVYKGDLSEDSFLATLPNADYIIHAAGYGQPAKFVANADRTVKINTVSTFALLDKLNKDGKFLFLSSSTVYSGLVKDKFSEEDIGITNTTHPRACYIEGKKCGETIVNAYRLKGINAKSVRLSYTYGPGVRGNDERVLYSFIRKAKSGKIDMFDDGSAERIYCYISDVIEMLWKVLLFGNAPIYNVGGKDKTTILDTAKIIAEYFKAEIIIPKSGEGFPGSAMLERLDIGKIEKEFGKMEFIDIKDGILRTIRWLEDGGEY